MAYVYNAKEILEGLQTYWTSRKMALLKYWDFYYGDRQRFYLDKFEGESDGEYNNRVFTAAIENHCAKTCDVLVGYLYGQPGSKNKMTVRITNDSGELVEKANKLLQRNVWLFNDMDSLRIRVALMASVTGVCVVRKVFVDSRTKLPFTSGVSKEDKAKYGSVRYDVYDSVDTMPLPLIDGDEIYPNILGAIVRYYEKDNFTGVTPLERLLQKTYTQEEILEVYDNKRFLRAKVESGSIVAGSEVSARNPYENIDLVFTLFSNYGDPSYLEGSSDLAQMISLQNTLNEINNADKVTIDYHSFPLLIMGGGAKLPPNFVRKVNSGLELDINQTVEYLTWDNVLDASAKFKEDIRKQMTVTSGVSQISRGNATDIGQVRSGAGLKTLFQADINAVGLKMPFFRKAERELALSTLRMWEQETGESFGEIYCDVEFPDDFVGLDELLKAQTEQIDLANSVRTITELVLAKHPEITSEEELSTLVKQALKEQAKLALISKPPVQTAKGQTSEKKSQEQQK